MNYFNKHLHLDFRCKRISNGKKRITSFAYWYKLLFVVFLIWKPVYSLFAINIGTVNDAQVTPRIHERRALLNSQDPSQFPWKLCISCEYAGCMHRSKWKQYCKLLQKKATLYWCIVCFVLCECFSINAHSLGVDICTNFCSPAR